MSTKSDPTATTTDTGKTADTAANTGADNPSSTDASATVDDGTDADTDTGAETPAEPEKKDDERRPILAKYKCSVHGFNDSHDDSGCFVQHPDLDPKRKKREPAQRRKPEPRPEPRPEPTAQPRKKRDEPTSERQLGMAEFLAAIAGANANASGAPINVTVTNSGSEVRKVRMGESVVGQTDIVTGHVLGIDESDDDRWVNVSQTGRPISGYTAKAVDRKLAAMAQAVTDNERVVLVEQPAPAVPETPAISAEDLAKAEQRGEERLLRSFELAEKLRPQPAPAPPPPVGPPTKFMRLTDGLQNGGHTGDNMIAGDFTFEEIMKLNPSIVRNADTARAEGKNRPWWIMLAVLGGAALITFFLLWALAPSKDDVRDARADAKFAQQVASDRQAARLAAEGAPRTYPITIGAVEAGEVNAGDVHAGDVHAGAVTSTGPVTVNNTVTRRSSTTRVVHVPAPAATSAPSATVAPSARCTGWWASKKAGSVKCFVDKASSIAAVCADLGTYSGSIGDASITPFRWINACAR